MSIYSARERGTCLCSARERGGRGRANKPPLLALFYLTRRLQITPRPTQPPGPATSLYARTSAAV